MVYLLMNALSILNYYTLIEIINASIFGVLNWVDVVLRNVVAHGGGDLNAISDLTGA
jgi:hypothetical protein